MLLQNQSGLNKAEKKNYTKDEIIFALKKNLLNLKPLSLLLILLIKNVKVS